MKGSHWGKVAFFYFFAVFGVGFVLGIFRVLLLVPRLGTRTAELIEMPLMMLATLFAARWAVLYFDAARKAPLRMGLTALSLLVAAELGLGRLRGLTLADYVLTRDPVSGSAYFVALALFGLMPFLVVRRLACPEHRARLLDRAVPAQTERQSIARVVATWTRPYQSIWAPSFTIRPCMIEVGRCQAGPYVLLYPSMLFAFNRL